MNILHKSLSEVIEEATILSLSSVSKTLKYGGHYTLFPREGMVDFSTGKGNPTSHGISPVEKSSYGGLK